MCDACVRFEQRLAAGTVDASHGAVAQLVERVHGMHEARGSIPLSSTQGGGRITKRDQEGRWLAGLVAGEGSFSVASPSRSFVADGTPRLRFVFSLRMATRDRPLLEQLQAFLGVGAIDEAGPQRAGWQPTSNFSISAIKRHREATIPFAEKYLFPCAKRDQFESWHQALDEYEQHRMLRTRWGQGRSTCSAPGCDGEVRGRQLCRSHYYRATGW